MKKIRLFFKNYPILLLLVVVVLFVRFLWLGVFPPGMTHDEFDIVLSSKAIAETGRDLSGTSFPLFFIKTQMEAKQTNLIPLFLSFYFKFVETNLLTVRLPFIFINLLLGLGVVKLIRLFFKDDRLSLIVALVYLTNPWFFVFSRQAFVAPTALMFLVWGVYFLFKKKENIFLSCFLFLLSTFCYMGSIVLVPPIVLILAIFKSVLDKKIGKNTILLTLIYFVIFAFYLGISFFVNDSTIFQRKGEVDSLMGEEISNLVNSQRAIMINFPGSQLLVNKFTIYGLNFIKKYFNVFNINSLFFTGDPRFTYTFGNHGLLYLIDAFLIFVGIYTLLKKNKNLFIVVTIIFLIAPLGPAISDVIYSIIFRAYPLSFVFVVLTSFGLWKITKNNYAKFIYILYFGFFVNFLLFFFFQYPVRLGEIFDLPERIAANVALREEKAGNRVTVITKVPYYFIKQIVFYDNINNWYTIPMKDNYQYKNIVITNNCDLNIDGSVIIDSRSGCERPDNEFLVVQQQKDAGYRYYLYLTTICKKTELESYRRSHKVSDYRVEKMDNSTLCNRWIFRPI